MAWRLSSGFVRVARFAVGALIAASVAAGGAAEAHGRRAHHHLNHHAYHHAVHHAYRRHLRHYVRHATAIPVSPAFSAIVVDANSGRTLYSAYENGLRHPASLTKVMTLYLLFEQLDRGTTTLETEIPISEHAAAQEPSKLGVRPGETITVEEAIKAIVTRSANDVAVAVAEAIGHSEGHFAEMMTRQAHALGMESTNYVNASGLPDARQITTAHDLAILGRAVQQRFPRYFHYFSTREFDFAGQTIGNHDHLLGRVDGCDGIKTGYTRASGFNLLTSVHRDGRALVAVVMGGRTAFTRDRIMENLIADHIAAASTVRAATLIADASLDVAQPARAEAATPPERVAALTPPEVVAAATPPERPRPIGAASAVPVRAPSAQAMRAAEETAQGDGAAEDDDAQLLRVAAILPVESRRVAPLTLASIGRPAVPTPAPRPVVRPPAPAPRTPAELGWRKGPDGVYRSKPAERNVRTAARAEAKAAKETTVAARQASEPQHGRGDWMIQIGATNRPEQAARLLARARDARVGALADARAVTEKVRRGEDTFYRARFAGLNSQGAELACRSLKQNGFACFAAHDE